MSEQGFKRVSVSRLALVGVVMAVVTVASLAAFIAASAPASSQLSAPMWLNAPSATLTGRDIPVSGAIGVDADLSGAVVKIYKREVGENADTFVTDATVSYSQQTGNVFQAVVPTITRSCVITATWEGDAAYLASSTWMFAGVKPKLTPTVKSATRNETKFRITVSPEQLFYRQPLTAPPFIADVQCRVHGAWTRFPGDLGVAGTDGKSWCTYSYYDLKPGKYLIRAHFGGTNYNVARVSVSQRIVVP